MLRRTQGAILAVLLAATACTSGSDPVADHPVVEPPAELGWEEIPATETVAAEAQGLVDEPGVRVTLSSPEAGEPGAITVPVVNRPATTPLTEDQASAVFERVTALSIEPGDQSEFNRPAETLLPPRRSAVVEQAFPPVPPNTTPEVTDKPLEVIRFQPDGDVRIAPFVSVTFNQPMVPLSTLDQLDDIAVPASMTPAMAGRWQWIGTRTLRFERDPRDLDRLPAATEFRLVVPSGTTAISGATLAEPFVQTFRTPPVEIDDFSHANSNSTILDPVLSFTFTGQIDPNAVLSRASLIGPDGPVGLRLATEAEIAADPTAGATLDRRFAAFTPIVSLRKDTAYQLDIGPGIPSIEGPREIETSYNFQFRTYGPFQIESSKCGWDRDCRPLNPFSIHFTNPIDVESFDPSMVTVTPEPAGLNISVSSRSLWIRGQTRANTTYAVAVSPELSDVFEQTLTGNNEVRFKTGEARPVLVPFSQPLITTDPFDPVPAVSVATQNHQELKVRVYEVDPNDYEDFVRFRQDLPSDRDDKAPAPGKQILNTTITVDGDNESFAETRIELDEELLPPGFGHRVVVVEIDKRLSWFGDGEDKWNNRPTTVWVQATRLGLDTFSDHQRHVVWVTDLETGEPVEGAEVRLRLEDDVKTVMTDGNGVAQVRESDANGRSTLGEVVATKGTEVAFLHAGQQSSISNPDQPRWYVFDDRGIYKPGETVRLKGWARTLTTSADGQLHQSTPGSVTYTVTDAQGVEIATGRAPLSLESGFDFSFDLPEGVNLGSASVQLKGPTYRWNHQFQVQEFRRPEFEVATSTTTAGPFVVDESGTVRAEASYYTGGALPGAAVNWQISTTTATYTPPKWSDFTFGEWIPWWERDQSSDSRQWQIDGITDTNGLHDVQVEVAGLTTNPVTVQAVAGVQDVNRQVIASTETFLVHPATRYVGLRSPSYFVEPNAELAIDVIVTDLDGNAVTGQAVTVEASRIEWRFVGDKWVKGKKDSQSCDVVTAAAAQECRFKPDASGTYRIESTVTDEMGRTQTTVLTRWVQGPASRPITQGVDREEAIIIPDKDEYEPGDVAKLLVQSPFSPASGLLITERAGIETVETFEIVDGSTELLVPIEDRHIPNIHARIELVGATDRRETEVAKRPAYAGGSVVLSVSPMSRRLAVLATPRDSFINPGGTTTVDLTVTDANGRPVADAELAVVVVDEAVLALTNYDLRDPLDVFYATIAAGTRSVHGRSSIILTDPAALVEQIRSAANDADGRATAEGSDDASAAVPASSDGEALGNKASGSDQIDVRQNFDALAVFAPEVLTDADGRASIRVPLPDNLTQYRIMVMAVNGDDHFGSGESSLTASLPLMVRPSAPRFANFGDTFEFPVVVQNLTDEAMDVDVAMRATNLSLTAEPAQRVVVPANDRVEVRFDVETSDAGTARFQVAAVAGDLTDAAQGSLPVYTPSTTETFATYGVIDSGTGIGPISSANVADSTGDGAILHNLNRIEGVYPQFGGLEVTTSSTAVQALTDSVIYLTNYRYSSSDAYASRIMAIAALRDVLEAFESPQLPSAAALDNQVSADLEALLRFEDGNGGYYSWSRADEISPYRSIQAAHAMVIAKSNGYPVNERALERSMQFLATIESRVQQLERSGLSQFLSAYALRVRHLNGDSDKAKAEALFVAGGESLGVDALAFLWPIVGAESATKIQRLIGNATIEQAGYAHFSTSYGEDAWIVLHSNRRTDGIVLDALVEMDPGSDLIPKVVAGLMKGQERGRWSNVQENSFILLALNNYFDAFESTTPDFVARVWLGDDYVAEHEYEGRSTLTTSTLVPMEFLVGPESEPTDDAQELIVAKDGEGRLYYRLGLQYAPSDLNLDPLDRGFVVARTYEGVDDPADVQRDEDGTWIIKAGSRVRVKLTMVADSRKTNVALVDPLPAGLEPINPELATSGLPPDDSPVQYDRWADWRAWTWYNHQNLRDDRAEVYTTYLWSGTFNYQYVAQATTPGEFVVPPAKAEEIYQPEVFGRSGSDRVIITQE